ncbi:unnamed protein product [Pelagomonas calceolata]|uniref:Endonuclease/exonuclease/phosphatase domain-containing protein n=3 Tax=Pelagomonas calceolata TaxID=35677 RepID=A0A8J2WZY3_9STRA|nr:unnamed protein product [Pelagomonas calceolata]
MANSAPLYRRRWAESSKKKEGVDLRVVQFNVLADGLSGRDTKLGGFDSAPKDSLKWEARRERLIEELFRHGPEPDVICLEEVDHFDDWFMPQLSKRGYRGFFLKKPKSPCLKTAPGSGLEDGCALFCREATVSVVCVETMHYAASNQVALLATVRVPGSSSFIVACTHLVARKTAEGEAQRKKQVCELMERLDTMGLPCVICLDMNAAPHDAAYAAQAYPATTSALRSAYRTALGAEPAWTTWKKRGTSEARHCIDYVLCSPEVGVDAVLLPPEDDEIVEARLPGWNYPSDHVALIADLRVPASQLISHRLEPDAGKIRGALSIVAILGCMVLGPCLPVAAFIALWRGHATLATMLATFVAITLTTGAHSPKLCAAYLKAAGWFPEVWLHVTRDGLEAMRGPASTLWCMHPHGTSIGFGFSLNGAVRFKTCDDMRYAPRELVEGVPSERRATCDGVMAPVLFRIPLLRQILLGFGCATPATKRRMCDLMNRGIDFGILPGGMHEVALYEKGRDRIYTRPGFVKYALQYGVCLLPAFTFGESDLYTNLRAPLYRSICEFTLSRFGFIIPVFWGPRWWCPLLPRDDVALHTVVAEPVHLPKIANPTRSDVEKFHGAYVTALTRLYDTHKAQFGYHGRELEVF